MLLFVQKEEKRNRNMCAILYGQNTSGSTHTELVAQVNSGEILYLEAEGQGQENAFPLAALFKYFEFCFPVNTSPIQK